MSTHALCRDLNLECLGYDPSCLGEMNFGLKLIASFPCDHDAHLIVL